MEPFNQPPFTFPSRKKLVNHAQGLLKLAEQQKVLSRPKRGFESNIDFNLYLGQACMPTTLNKDRIDFHPVLPTATSVYVQPGLKEGMYELATLTNDEEDIKKLLSANNRLRAGQYRSAEHVLKRLLTAEEISSRTITPNIRQSNTGIAVHQNFRTSTGPHANGIPIGRNQQLFNWRDLRYEQKQAIMSLLGCSITYMQRFIEFLNESNLQLSINEPLDFSRIKMDAYNPNSNWHMVLMQVFNRLASIIRSDADLKVLGDMRAKMNQDSEIHRAQFPVIPSAPPISGAQTQRIAEAQSNMNPNDIVGDQKVNDSEAIQTNIIPPHALGLETVADDNDRVIAVGADYPGTSSSSTQISIADPLGTKIKSEAERQSDIEIGAEGKKERPQTRRKKKGGGIALHHRHRHLAEFAGGKIDDSHQVANIMEDSINRPVATQGLTDIQSVTDAQRQVIEYETHRQEMIDDAINDFVPLKARYKANEIIAHRMNKRARDAEDIDHAGYSATSSGTARDKRRYVTEVTLPSDIPHTTLSITGSETGAIFSGHLMRGKEAVPRALQVQVPEQHVSNEAPIRQRVKYPNIAEKVVRELTPTQLSRKKHLSTSINDAVNFKNVTDLGSFGKYLLDFTELRKKPTYLKLRLKRGGSISMKIPRELGVHIHTLHQSMKTGGKIKAKQPNELTKKSRVLFHAIAHGSGMQGVGDINVPHKDRIKIIAGEIEAGNDNPILQAQLKLAQRQQRTNEAIERKKKIPRDPNIQGAFG